MLCPFCNNDDSKVIDSRDSGDGIRRRRECLACSRRFTTYERVQTNAVMVIKRDGRREEFHRDKLWTSLSKACAKLPLPTGSIDKVVEAIEAEVVGFGKAEVPSDAIGELVMDRLRDMDRVAYIRFASIYRDFRDIESFREEIEALLEPRETVPTVPVNQLSFLDDVEVDEPSSKRRKGRPKKASGDSIA
ncbi:MAG: transcriptional regulator NrdR [Chloroflexi bacterium]|nr:transcriptional regulator NrdR [Chloroflexota bacterium]MDA1228061.1 transcriptional regulator NrdR [Chloroflexota bacterium]